MGILFMAHFVGLSTTIFPAQARWDDTLWDPTGAGSRTKPQEPAISERGHRYGLDMALYMGLYMDYVGYIIKI